MVVSKSSSTPSSTRSSSATPRSTWSAVGLPQSFLEAGEEAKGIEMTETTTPPSSFLETEKTEMRTPPTSILRIPSVEKARRGSFLERVKVKIPFARWEEREPILCCTSLVVYLNKAAHYRLCSDIPLLICFDSNRQGTPIAHHLCRVRLTQGVAHGAVYVGDLPRRRAWRIAGRHHHGAR